MDFDETAARQERTSLETTRRAMTRELFHVSDDTDTVINIRLDQYQRSANAPRVLGFRKQFRWRNLSSDAKLYPQSVRLTRAASATAGLLELCDHPALQKLP